MQIMSGRKSRESRGYYEVLEFVFTNYSDIDISERTILDLHKQLLKYDEINEHQKGKYKELDNKVETKDSNGNVLRVLVVGTPADLAPEALNDLVVWVNNSLTAQKYPSLIIISAFIVEFLKIHPFVDGNGRVSRILTNLLLLKCGYTYVNYYPHEKIIEDDTEKYYIALSSSQKTFGTPSESIRSWTEYFLSVLLEQAKKAAALQIDPEFGES
jgi:Fic family protein